MSRVIEGYVELKFKLRLLICEKLDLFISTSADRRILKTNSYVLFKSQVFEFFFNNWKMVGGGGLWFYNKTPSWLKRSQSIVPNIASRFDLFVYFIRGL